MSRFRPTPSSVIAVFALVVAMSGAAVAATHTTASSIKKHSIAGNRLKNNTVTGKQVKESTLGVVPRATAAGSVDGVSMLRVHAIVAGGGAEKTIASFGRLKINFGCAGAPGTSTQLDAISAFTTGDANSAVIQGTTVATHDNDNFAVGQDTDLTNAEAEREANGDISVAWSDGHYTDFHFTDDFPPIFGTVQSCVVAGVITFS